MKVNNNRWTFDILRAWNPVWVGRYGAGASVGERAAAHHLLYRLTEVRPGVWRIKFRNSGTTDLEFGFHVVGLQGAEDAVGNGLATVRARKIRAVTLRVAATCGYRLAAAFVSVQVCDPAVLDARASARRTTAEQIAGCGSLVTTMVLSRSNSSSRSCRAV